MNLEILEDLGLTPSEIKTYITLLELGSSTAGPILEKSGLQNSVIHRALNSLIGKGIINFIMEGKRKVYQATNPENLIEYIEEKKRRFQEILPELKNKQHAKKEEIATIYKGKRGLQEIYNTIINTKAKEYNTFGGGKDVSAFMGLTWWINLHARRAANKLPSRQIFDETVREQASQITSKPLIKARYLPAQFASFQETVIAGDYVAINVFTEDGYGFLIKDKKVADSYRKYFEALWKIAKKWIYEKIKGVDWNVRWSKLWK